MSRIFWDTNVFIYLFEGHAVHHQEVVSLRNKMVKRGDELLTSWMTVGEIQVESRKTGRREDYRRYKDAIVQSSRVLSFEEDASEQYRMIRNTNVVRGPDAIQLACAAAVGAEIFVTNDKRLHGMRVEGIHFIASIATAEALL